MTLAQINALIAAVCPIIGINSNGVIWFDLSATPAQQAQAQTIMAQNLPNLIVR